MFVHRLRNNLIKFLILVVFATVHPVGFAQDSSVQRIYLAPDDHTDYFWTADDVQYRAAFIEMLDFYLDEIDKNKGQPHEFQTRWNCDGSLWLWEYEHNKTPAEFKRLIGRIRDGHISAPMTALASTYGAQPAEAVLRGMYYAGSLERRFDLKFPMAVAMENQTLPLGLGALWAGAGAKYSWRGICDCATRMPHAPFKRRDKEIYWWTGLDDSRILMKWYSVGLNNSSVGGYAEARRPREAIKWVRNNIAFEKRHPFLTIGIFGQGWDDLKTVTNDFPKIAREMTSKDQKVIVSNEEDFFRQFERQYGGSIEQESLAFGNEWDLYCVSMAEQTGRVRRSVEKLRTAEAIASIVSLENPAFWADRKKARDQAHMDLGLYWEHDWTADRNEEMRTKRADWQLKIANRISAYVDELHAAASTELSLQIDHEKRPQRFYVFNSLGWPRSAVIELPFDGAKGNTVVDVTTGKEILSWPTKKGQSGVLEIFAQDIPAVGYRVFEVRPPASAVSSVPQAGRLMGTVFENSKLTLVINNAGTVTSLIEKSSGQEFAGPNGLNVMSGKSLDDGKVMSKIELVSTSPFATTIQITSGTPLLHRTRMTLERDADWVEIENIIETNFDDVRTWDFDFNLDKPNVHHEEVGAILNAKLENDGGHYADRNARYDWLSLGHFVDMEGVHSGTKEQKGVTIANADCAFFRLGDSDPKNLDTASSHLSIMIGGQIDGPSLGIRNQHGDKRFVQRFAIGPRVKKSFDQVAAMRWSLEWQNPLVSGAIDSQSQLETGNNKLPANAFSLLAADKNPAVLLWSLKPSEEGIGQGLIARAWNLSNGKQSSTIKFPGLGRAFAATHIETDINELPVADATLKIEFAPQQMRTVRLKKGSK